MLMELIQASWVYIKKCHDGLFLSLPKSTGNDAMLGELILTQLYFTNCQTLAIETPSLS